MVPELEPFSGPEVGGKRLLISPVGSYWEGKANNPVSGRVHWALTTFRTDEPSPVYRQRSDSAGIRFAHESVYYIYKLQLWDVTRLEFGKVGRDVVDDLDPGVAPLHL